MRVFTTGCIEVVKLLVADERCDIDVQLANDISRPTAMVSSMNIHASKRNTGRTALSFAAEAGFEHIVRELIEAKADVNAQKEDGWTALTYSTQTSRMSAI